MTLAKVVPTCSNAGGNTKSPAKKTISPAKRWCFTLNNYSIEEECSIQLIIKKWCKEGGYGRECGKKGTEHLQGYIEFKDKGRPLNKKYGFPKTIHWEKCKGNRGENLDYIKKEGDWWWFPTPYEINIPEFYEWQENIKYELELEPDDRKIVWIWEDQGCAGKTTFQKWIFLNYNNVVVLSGAKADMKHAIVQYIQNNGIPPRIVLINIPKVNKNHISISGIEEIKDMFFFSGKYEGGMVCGKNPHVIIFANEPPYIESMSEDRWDIRNI